MIEAQPLAEGQMAPAFEITIQDGTTRSLSDYAGRKLALYFYPKDMTPGCTVQACNLESNSDALARAGVQVLGVSSDPAARHQKFIDKFSLGFDLGADEDRSVQKAFGVWGKKKFMGREFEGTHRVTFLIDEGGKIASVILKAKVKDHSTQILEGFGI